MRFLVFPRDRLCNFSELPIHPRKFANGVQLLLLILRLLTAPECGVKGSVKPEEFLQIRGGFSGRPWDPRILYQHLSLFI